MSIEQVQAAVDGIGVAFEELKKTNDARLAEIEKKGSSDVLLTEKLEKIQTEISAQQELKERIERLETTSSVMAEIGEKASKDGIEYKEAFVDYVKKGYQGPALEEKALTVGNDNEGGYLVTPEMSDTIITKLFETSPMRQVANVVTISSDALDIIVDNTAATSGGFVGEIQSISETAAPTVDKKSIYVHEQYAEPRASQKILDDAAIDVESWLSDKITDILSRTENTKFFTGTGDGEPRGILTQTAGTSWGEIEQVSSDSGTGGTVSADDIPNLYYTLLPEYARNSTFLMARATEKAVRLLKDGESRYMWQPAFTRDDSATLMGVPVIQCSDMAALATDSLSIALGDFQRGYTIVDRLGIRVLRDPYSTKPYVKFYATKRVGGDVTNFDAIKLLKMDA